MFSRKGKRARMRAKAYQIPHRLFFAAVVFFAGVMGSEEPWYFVAVVSTCALALSFLVVPAGHNSQDKRKEETGK